MAVTQTVKIQVPDRNTTKHGKEKFNGGEGRNE